MGTTNYEVTTQLTLTGARDYTAGLKGGARAAGDLQASLGKLGGGAVGLARAGFGALETAITAVGTAASVAFGGAAYAGLRLAEAIGGNLSELENSANQLGAVIGAATQTGFAKGKLAAGELFEQFQQDAIVSAGETTDFVNIAKGIVGPVLGATNSMKELHDMTAATVAASTALGEGFDHAAQDVAHILQGVAGNHVALWRMLTSMRLIKMEAKEFNQLSPGKRFELLKKALGDKSFADAAEAFGNSWTGLTSSLADVSKGLGRIAGTPAFSFIKSKLVGLNTVLQEQVKGGKLADAFEHLGASVHVSLMRLEDALGNLFPDAVGSASGFVGVIEHLVTGGLGGLTRATQWTADHWTQIHQAVEKTAAALGRAADRGEGLVRALGGGSFEKGAARLGEAFLATKAASALGVPEMVSAGALTASGAAGTARALGLFGGGGGAAAGAVAGGEAAAAGGGALAGVGGILAAAPAVAALALAAASLGSAAYAAEHNTFGVGTVVGFEFMRIKTASDELVTSTKPLITAVEHLWHAGEPLIGVLGSVVSYLTPVGWAFHIVSLALPTIERGLSEVAKAGTAAVEVLARVTDQLTKMLGLKKLTPVDEEADRQADRQRRADTVFGHGIIGFSTGKTLVDVAKAADKKEPQKVEVTLKFELGDSNEDAIYIKTAREIRNTFERMNQNPSVFRSRQS